MTREPTLSISQIIVNKPNSANENSIGIRIKEIFAEKLDNVFASNKYFLLTQTYNRLHPDAIGQIIVAIARNADGICKLHTELRITYIQIKAGIPKIYITSDIRCALYNLFIQGPPNATE